MAMVLRSQRAHRAAMAWSLSFTALLFPPSPHAAACVDLDDDGFYDVEGCGTARDCNDDDPFMFPGAAETCDGRDSDCNGLMDDHPSCGRTCDNPERFPGTIQVTNSGDRQSEQLDLVWTGDGWIVSYWRQWQGDCTWVELQRLNSLGAPTGAPVTVAGGVGVVQANFNPRIAWSGTELAVVWEQAPAVTDPMCGGTETSTYDVLFQRYDRNLQVVGEPIRLGCTTLSSERLGDVAWNGRVYGVVWNHSFGDFTRFAILDRFGAQLPADGCGSSLGSEGFAFQHRLAATGSSFGAVWDDVPPEAGSHSDLYFRGVAEDGMALGPAAIRETHELRRTVEPAMTWSDGVWAISWSDERDNPTLQTNEIYFMRLELDGTKIDPPGDIRATCCQDALSGPHRYFSSLAWTGEEYGLAYDQRYQSQSFLRGDIFFRRLSSAGANVGPPLLITPDAAIRARQVALAWNGREYGLAYVDVVGGVTESQVYFARIGCNCADFDGDQFSSCAGNDCDDANPLVNPLRPELCLDGLDNNCDGNTDCQDTTVCPASVGTLPGEVQGLAMGADKATWSWQSEPGSQRYDLLTGDIGFLRADAGFDRADCLSWRIPETSYTDERIPVQRRGFFVLVRGKADTCLLGTWGSSLRDQASTLCP